MKQVLLIATGGTIACRETENGLSPALTGEELLGLMPELNGICSVGVSDLMNLDSTDLTAADRAAIARTVWENRSGYDGFVRNAKDIAAAGVFVCAAACVAVGVCVFLAEGVLLTALQYILAHLWIAMALVVPVPIALWCIFYYGRIQ